MGYLKKILNNKKNTVEKMIIILVIGIVLMVLGDFGAGSKKDESKHEIICEENMELSSKSIEKEMEEILGQIEGAGEVKVMITYKTSKEVIHQLERKETINDTKEDDGGRVVKQREFSNNIAFEDNNGRKVAVVKKEIEPLIKGVVVVARGALDDNVRRNLQIAAKVLTDIPMHKISVFAMKK